MTRHDTPGLRSSLSAAWRDAHTRRRLPRHCAPHVCLWRLSLPALDSALFWTVLLREPLDRSHHLIGFFALRRVLRQSRAGGSAATAWTQGPLGHVQAHHRPQAQGATLVPLAAVRPIWPWPWLWGSWQWCVRPAQQRHRDSGLPRVWSVHEVHRWAWMLS